MTCHLSFVIWSMSEDGIYSIGPAHGTFDMGQEIGVDIVNMTCDMCLKGHVDMEHVTVVDMDNVTGQV